MIFIKKVTDPVEKIDGHRVLVDRLWPRGIKKTSLQMEQWMKNIAPSTLLRQWYHHDPTKWNEFRDKYWKELDSNQAAIAILLQIARDGDLTLLFGSKERIYNNAAALKEYLDEKL
jgi:uncharacterized protein YeaO (DUF488 family)